MELRLVRVYWEAGFAVIRGFGHLDLGILGWEQ